ncbi:TetR/AcrR family transcriptional regulator [Frankia gtarii]|uniref:TetR/AcrR family transcriptional regulator n=1 Tax=Frankia gtarii TaxID=2950102 RepID=UPI0021BF0A72|nr:TetR/AcrR family transcriptional regulator [Frankia gtarii]
MATTDFPRPGRRRTFDRARALEVAMFEFWRRGYDAVSMAELTARMGIAAPSLYAAFGDKRSLFREVVDTYTGSYGAFFDRALAAEETVGRGVHRALRTAAVEYTRPDRPPGCLVLSAAVNCGTASADVEALLRERREANTAALRERIVTDIAAGVLPAATRAEALARYVGAVLQGMSQQARDGAHAADLLAVVDVAMAAWPVETATR